MTDLQCGASARLFDVAETVPEFKTYVYILFQASASILALLLWLLLELKPTRRAYLDSFRMQGYGVALLATSALGILTWRVFDLLECEGRAEGWRVIGIVGVVLLNFVLIMITTRCVRVGILAFLLLASASVFTDWALRGGLLHSKAAVPFAAAQQLWALLSIVACSHLPGKRIRTRALQNSVSTTPTIDSLTRRECSECKPSGSLWSFV